MANHGFRFRPGEDPDLLLSVGEFFVRFSELEGALRDTFIALLRSDLETDLLRDVIAGTMEFATLCNVVRALLKVREPARRPPDKEIDRVFKACMRASDVRNHLAHAEWHPAAGARKVSRQSLTPTTKYANGAELVAETSRLLGLSLDVLDLHILFTPKPGQIRASPAPDQPGQTGRDRLGRRRQ